jgi:hypothetical protein
VLALGEPAAGSPLEREIVIPVDVPEVAVVHTAELRWTNVASGRGETVQAAVGQMLAAELHLRHTRSWGAAAAESGEADDQHKEGSAYEFAYEVHAHQDVWLLGGRRRGTFTGREGETQWFPLILIPQRPGYLLLPISRRMWDRRRGPPRSRREERRQRGRIDRSRRCRRRRWHHRLPVAAGMHAIPMREHRV